jgi:hypothetical protein
MGIYKIIWCSGSDVVWNSVERPPNKMSQQENAQLQLRPDQNDDNNNNSDNNNDNKTT